MDLQVLETLSGGGGSVRQKVRELKRTWKKKKKKLGDVGRERRIFLFFLNGSRDLTQGLIHTRQDLYH